MSRRPRVSMPSLDARIARAIVHHPAWLASVYARLDGYPDPDRCWLWTGGKHERGYGRVRLPAVVGGNVAGTHRIVWIDRHGPIPPGWVLDHDGDNGCHETACGNDGHVQCVPEKINVHTGDSPWGINARKTHCPRGHELTGGNLTPSSVARGGRSCRICAATRAR